ncbi:MAG: SAM-dependent chlorinase/fluorinase [Chloroflexi bacterium]|nr:SAM-dependent chlorinase/fluorinase [Chloroflexota bacterium]
MVAVITLTTDFGMTDAYVAAMKGVILGINPEAKLVDICHSIRPQDIRHAAFILGTAHTFFPAGTIHMVVVDPGVGTDRRAIIISTPSAQFVAPDNGVLSHVITQSSAKGGENYADRTQIELPPGLEAVAITESKYWRSPVSPTFHGRDIFSPVAARLSLGCPASDFGEPVTSVVMLPPLHPQLTANNILVGHILHIDNFGNLITNIRNDDLSQEMTSITIEIGRQLISGMGQTYADREGLSALIGSFGYLEIAVKDGNAASLLNAEIGDEVKVRLR